MTIKPKIVDQKPDNPYLKNLIPLLNQLTGDHTECKKTLVTSDLIKPIAPHVFLLDMDLKEQSNVELLQKLNQLKGDLLWFNRGDEQQLHDQSPVKSNAHPLRHIRIILELLRDNTIEATNKSDVKTIKDQIAVPIRKGYTFLPIQEIIRCEGASQYTEIIHKNGKLISCRNIGYFVKALKSCGFFATHKSHLVNLRYVDSYTSEGELILKTGNSIPLSRRRKGAFFEQFC